MGDTHGALALCTFCDKEPAGSNEHVWPVWVREFMLDEVFSAAPDEHIRRVRKLLDVTVQCVCHKCNTGWMRRLENHVSPWLKLMIVGQPNTLQKRDIARLRRWAIKTAAMLECVRGWDKQAISRRTRHQVHQGQLARNGVVLLGHYSGPRLKLEFLRTLYADSLDDHAYVAWTTFHIGQVVLHVLTDADVRNPGVTIMRNGLRHYVDLVAHEGGEVDFPGDLVGLDDEILAIHRDGPHPDLRAAPWVPERRPMPQSTPSAPFFGSRE